MRGSNFSVSDSGWTKDGIARLWFTDTFLKNVGPARPQVLICDGHGSHNNVEFVELAKQNDIIVVELPSHTSNWTKPFDRTVFKSLKSHWNTVIDNFTKGTGVAVGHRQFLRLFNVAWGAALTPATIKNGFAATSAIPNEAFCHSEISVPRVETASSPPSSANSSTFLLPSSSPSVSVQNLSVQSVSSVDHLPRLSRAFL